MAVIMDRVKRVATGLINTVYPTGVVAAWAPSKYPQNNGQSIITAEVVRGPSVSHTIQYHETIPTVLRWTLTAASVATTNRLVIALTGGRWYYDAAGTETVETARDAMLAILDSDLDGVSRDLPGVTIAGFGTDSIDFTDTGFGNLWGACALGAGTTLAPTATAEAEVETGRADVLLEFQAYAGGAGVEAGALIGGLAGALSGHDVKFLRDRWGVAFGAPMSETIDLTKQAGADWESRAAARLPAALRSYRAVAVDTIGTVALTTVGDVVLNFEVSE